MQCLPVYLISMLNWICSRNRLLRIHVNYFRRNVLRRYLLADEHERNTDDRRYLPNVKIYRSPPRVCERPKTSHTQAACGGSCIRLQCYTRPFYYRPPRPRVSVRLEAQQWKFKIIIFISQTETARHFVL